MTTLDQSIKEGCKKSECIVDGSLNLQCVLKLFLDFAILYEYNILKDRS